MIVSLTKVLFIARYVTDIAESGSKGQGYFRLYRSNIAICDFVVIQRSRPQKMKQNILDLGNVSPEFARAIIGNLAPMHGNRPRPHTGQRPAPRSLEEILAETEAELAAEAPRQC